ncbi:hypothetical protein CcrColossus_gp430 [Caulobacter phage CcrColossus]|uniref:Uncharacterized protein n=1 Tax=Caulobacter phage CcrColossus TaxID=1211640 RepID=K4JVA5_9CAUD|nr:hypothetical protein CcrColossus_gp430 [Caulobacter phage CcrColossus]AFU88300.1 hypothetical protein CcrColossus_gp430 [Caulobacter phage CcrColossus]
MTFYQREQEVDSEDHGILRYSAEEAAREEMQKSACHMSVTVSRLIGKLHTRGLLNDLDIVDVLGATWTTDPKEVTLVETGEYSFFP